MLRRATTDRDERAREDHEPAAGRRAGQDAARLPRGGAPRPRLRLAVCWPGSGPSCGRTARYLFASISMIVLGLAALNLARTVVMGGSWPSAQEASPGQACCGTASLLSLLVLGVQALTFVQMYTMQIAGRPLDGGPAHAPVRLHAAARAAVLRSHPGRPLVTRATNDVDALSRAVRLGGAQRHRRPRRARGHRDSDVAARRADVAHRLRRAAGGGPGGLVRAQPGPRRPTATSGSRPRASTPSSTSR